MLKQKDGKIVVPKRFMEWLNKTERPNNSYQIALINRVGWGFRLETKLSYDDETYEDLTCFAIDNKVQLTRALLDEKEFTAEEEKKYYMMAPDGFDTECKYLKYDVVGGTCYIGNRRSTSVNKTQFTQSEIDAMPQKFRDFFRLVEVEEV